MSSTCQRTPKTFVLGVIFGDEAARSFDNLRRSRQGAGGMAPPRHIVCVLVPLSPKLQSLR